MKQFKHTRLVVYQATSTLDKEQSNDRKLIYRLGGNYCINYVLVFALFATIFLVEGPLIVFKIQIFVVQRFDFSHMACNNTSYTSSKLNFI